MKQFGSLYRAFAPLGYKRDDVDDLFVFEAAALLGIGEPEAEGAAPDTAGMSPGMARAMERMRADQEGRPAPEPEAPNPMGLSQLMTFGA